MDYIIKNNNELLNIIKIYKAFGNALNLLVLLFEYYQLNILICDR